MKIYKLYTLRKSEVEEIYASLGGKFGFRERLQRDGTGSPFLYYLNGHPFIDELNERATDELRINFEEFKNGLMVGIAERTHPYILPLRPGDVRSISIRLTEEKVNPRKGTFFNWLLGKGVKLSVARFFAGSREYEEAKTDFVLQMTEHAVHCWIPAEQYLQLRDFFEKSQFAHLLKAAD